MLNFKADNKLTTAVEDEFAGWIAAHAGVPEVDVQVAPDAVWMIQPGIVWSNCVTRIRLAEDSVEKRLNKILSRFRASGRGVGFWVSAQATPKDLALRLKANGLRCRKHFPAMYCDLSRLPANAIEKPEVKFRVITDHGIYLKHAHPYFGMMHTTMRQFELQRLRWLTANRRQQVWDVAIEHQNIPVGAATLCRVGNVVGFHDVGVLAKMRRQGIGTALMQHACKQAREMGCQGAVLISSGMGYGMYQRVGFREVGKISYWYRQYRVT